MKQLSLVVQASTPIQYATKGCVINTLTWLLVARASNVREEQYDNFGSSNAAGGINACDDAGQTSKTESKDRLTRLYRIERGECRTMYVYDVYIDV